jgi:hypothetical protein
VGESSWIMIVILLAPFTVFVLIAFTGIAGWTFTPANWLLLPEKPDLMECGLLLLWNMGMWESAAACAGEVKCPVTRDYEPSHALPRHITNCFFKPCSPI